MVVLKQNVDDEKRRAEQAITDRDAVNMRMSEVTKIVLDYFGTIYLLFFNFSNILIFNFDRILLPTYKFFTTHTHSRSKNNN